VVSILIVNWNGRRYLADCLESVAAKVTVPYEVIVVDNGSTDGSDVEAERGFPSVRVVRSGENLGFARGNNFAARLATGNHLLLLNNDTLLRSDIADAVAVLDADPTIGAVGALMFGGAGEPRPSAARFPTPLRLWRFASLFYKKPLPARRIGGVDVHPCDYVEGSFLMTPAAAWKVLNGMDEGNFMYGDDVEYCRSLFDAGFKTVQCPSVEYVHFGGYDHARMAVLFGGFRRYHRKFSGPLTRMHAEFVLRAGLLLRLPWYRWKARKGDATSVKALENALRLNRNWEQETGGAPSGRRA
jgi:GT2 family glycosyltransferase